MDIRREINFSPRRIISKLTFDNAVTTLDINAGIQLSFYKLLYGLLKFIIELVLEICRATYTLLV
jgi:hypothetical protein